MALFIGVDGCRGGWFAVSLDETLHWQAEVFPDLQNLWRRHKRASLILIDMPIGLKTRGTEERKCDKMGRKILGRKRGSSIFSVPARKAVQAKNYTQASFINRQLTGKGLSRQTWGIVPRIREMDLFMRRKAKLQGIIRESHPEICFWALAGKITEHRKGVRKGYEERLNILRYRLNVVQDIIHYSMKEYRREEVARDDILDALALVLIAFEGYGKLISIPEEPEYDEKNLRMEMVYYIS